MLKIQGKLVKKAACSPSNVPKSLYFSPKPKPTKARRTAAKTKPFIKDVDDHLKDVKFFLRDINDGMITGWRKIYEKELSTIQSEEHRALIKQNFEISKGDIFMKDALYDAIVSPANSFGFMDGGIDWVLSERFGWQLSERLQEIIKGEDYFGELLVGQAVILETKDPKGAIKYLISAPTMRVPLDVHGTPNAYLAFKAILMEVRKHNKLVSEQKKEGTPIKTVICCGLGTAVGLMPFTTCAYQMLEAYKTVALGMVYRHTDLGGFVSDHTELVQQRDPNNRSLAPSEDDSEE